MLLDIIIPTSIRSIGLVNDAIDSIQENTVVPHNIIVIVDGGNRRDIDGVLTRLKQEASWELDQDLFRGYVAAMNAGFHKSKSEFMAVIPPEVRLQDKGWFEKMWAPFSKDPTTMIVDTFPHTRSTTAIPAKRGLHTCGKKVKVFLTKRLIMGSLPIVPNYEKDPVLWLEKKAIQNGGSVWNAPGVMFLEVENECHDASEETRQFGLSV